MVAHVLRFSDQFPQFGPDGDGLWRVARRVARPLGAYGELRALRGDVRVELEGRVVRDGPPKVVVVLPDLGSWWYITRGIIVGPSVDGSTVLSELVLLAILTLRSLHHQRHQQEH